MSEDSKITIDLDNVTTEPDVMVDVFKSSLLSCKYVFSNSKVANFVGGKYYTEFESEILELNREIKFGNPHFEYVGKMAKADINPVSALKRAAIREFLAEQRAKVGRVMGNSVQGPLIASAANTDMLAEVIGQEKLEQSSSVDEAPKEAVVTEGAAARLAALKTR